MVPFRENMDLLHFETSVKPCSYFAATTATMNSHDRGKQLLHKNVT